MELDGPRTWTPYELLNTSFRNSQKVVEKELSQVVASIADLEKKKEKLTKEETQKKLIALAQRLETLKQKRAAVATEEKNWIQHCQQRLEHLPRSTEENESDSLATLRRRHRDRFTGALTAHLRTRGCQATAQLLSAEEPGDAPEATVGVAMATVTEALRQHNVLPALQWCARHRAALRKRESSLEFRLRRQHFLSLVANGERAAALEYARSHLGNHSNRFPREVAQAMAAVAFGPSSSCPQYRALFDPQRWLELVDQFCEEQAQIYHVCPTSPLLIYLEAGLGALKTVECESNSDQETERIRRDQCPVCLPLFRRAAKVIPYAPHTQSSLVCGLSGEPMDDENPPLVFPSGFAFGQRALRAQAQQHDGWVTCPRTQEVCRLEDLRKAYIS